MALAEMLPNDTSMFLKNTRNCVNRNAAYRAAGNDGDDDGDDEDSVVIINQEQWVQTSRRHFLHLFLFVLF